ncbi:MAG: hypothetical protein VX668_03345, partial [Planctomycetota bacterium]|nr:hypothetical protein [Planctomycetota bacterium]
MIFGFATGINLLLQIQQIQVSGHMRSEPGNLDVISQRVRVTRLFSNFTAKEPLLIIETRPPSQTATDLEIFAHDVSNHVLWFHALGWIVVVQTPG